MTDRKEHPRAVCEQEFERLCETWDLDTDDLDDSDRASLRGLKRTFVRVMARGDLLLEEDGALTYTPRFDENQTPIKFHKPTGSLFMAADGSKSASYKLLGRLCKEHPSRFADMDVRDFKIVSVLAIPFFA